MRWIVLLGVIFVGLAGAFMAFIPSNSIEPERIPGHAIADIAGQRFSLEVADTPERRARGLSGRTNIPERGGMVFVFTGIDRPTFWMKDMHIPIDIFWVRGDEIVFVHANVPPPESGTPDYALEQLSPPEDIDAVIETRAGTADLLGIRKDSRVKISLELPQS